MSVTTVYAAEVLNVIAERRDLELFMGTPIFIHSGVDEELVGWLGCQLPTNGYPCEHMGMGDDGSTACWSATEINRLRDDNESLRIENVKLRELAAEAIYLMQANGPDCGLCKHYRECWTGEAMDYSPSGCIICNDARELGVEVDE